MDALPSAGRYIWTATAVLITFNLVTVSWSFFRPTDLAESLTCIEMLFRFDPGRMFAASAGDVSLWSLVAALFRGLPGRPRSSTGAPP